MDSIPYRLRPNDPEGSCRGWSRAQGLRFSDPSSLSWTLEGILFVEPGNAELAASASDQPSTPRRPAGFGRRGRAQASGQNEEPGSRSWSAIAAGRRRGIVHAGRVEVDRYVGKGSDRRSENCDWRTHGGSHGLNRGAVRSAWLSPVCSWGQPRGSPVRQTETEADGTRGASGGRGVTR